MIIQDITAKDMATILHIDVNSAKEMLDGTIPFEIEDFELIANFLGVTTDSLVRQATKSFGETKI